MDSLRIKSAFEMAKIVFIGVIFATLAISLLIWLLSLILLLMQRGADLAGYTFHIPDQIGQAVLAVAGAIGVAVVALYGVRSQNISAEKRHKIDSSLALRKDIFLQVAEAFSIQHSYLLSLADPAITDDIRKEMLKDSTKAFFKLQVVASREAIIAMIEANQEWSKVMLDIHFMGQLPQEATSLQKIERLDAIQKKITPFMRKLWKFNIVARTEIESAFDNNDSYFDTMDKKYSELSVYLDEVRAKLSKTS
jgi:hypothetical protein